MPIDEGVMSPSMAATKGKGNNRIAGVPVQAVAWHQNVAQGVFEKRAVGYHQAVPVLYAVFLGM